MTLPFTVVATLGFTLLPLTVPIKLRELKTTFCKREVESLLGQRRPPPPRFAKRLEQVLGAGECASEWLEMLLGVESEGFDAERFASVSRRLKSNRTSTFPGEGHSMTKRRVARLIVEFLGVTLGR